MAEPTSTVKPACVVRHHFHSLGSQAPQPPHAPRHGASYRAIGYPVLPAIYIVMAVFLEIQLLRHKPQNTWPGLIIVLIGLPVYFLWRLFSRNRSAPV
jgi:hypothetical protein